MRTSLEFPDTLLRQLKLLALERGTSFRAVTLDLIEKGLEASNASRQASQRSEVLPVLHLKNAPNLPVEKMTNADLMQLLDGS